MRGGRLRGRKMVQVILVVGGVLAMATLGVQKSGAAVRYVPSQYPTIQAGIDAAVTGDTVLVAEGNYRGPGNIDLDYSGKTIVVESERGPEHSFIDCGNSGIAVIFENNEGKNAVFRGFTIMNGAADG